MSDTLWMEHPDLGPDRRQKVTRKQFEGAWVNSGWVEVDGPLDPAKLTVAEVKEHLIEHPEQTEEILEAEKKGKSRSTLLDSSDE